MQTINAARLERERRIMLHALRAIRDYRAHAPDGAPFPGALSPAVQARQAARRALLECGYDEEAKQ